MKAKVKEEIQRLLAQAGKGKTVRQLRTKYEKAQTLSKREMKILRTLIEQRQAA